MRWIVESGRWQRPHSGVLVAHCGPLTPGQRLWADLLCAGPGAVVAGATALILHGLRGIDPGPPCLLVPHGRQVTDRRDLRVHSSRRLAEDVQLQPMPRRTRVARSAVDAARWASSQDQARLFVVAAVQQRLVRPGDVLGVVERLGNVRRRGLIEVTCAELAGGAQTLAEIDFGRLCRRFGLPKVSRQVERRDSRGRRRWLDAYFDEFAMVVEVDGAAHMGARQWWDDLARSNDLTVGGDSVLRFTSWQVREHPADVALVIARALRTRGWRERLQVGKQ